MLIQRREIGKKILFSMLLLPFQSMAKKNKFEEKYIDTFGKVALKLTDFPLDKDLIKTFYYSLAETESNFGVEIIKIYDTRITKNSSEKLSKLEKKIILTLYSGKVGNKKVTYTNSIEWLALSNFTKPPGICGGFFGFWNKPPK
ncbi:sugar dehydrogenase complex small subunit [Pigmentibacter sp. JX0631]|uniref:sugar dehydrogenase complex small subunit n=1 Tax=Pigmentibacter sp. JX0631 TaxID=2976982 RepID=UPI00246989E9|nr:sugar dehydrogenase complex small subunit [Pigmentibacter sp. JX0631]WGL58484.1 sugar dehydrogenase complex small subunit [Pigmentibacter sp. JX0631]